MIKCTNNNSRAKHFRRKIFLKVLKNTKILYEAEIRGAAPHCCLPPVFTQAGHSYNKNLHKQLFTIHLALTIQLCDDHEMILFLSFFYAKLLYVLVKFDRRILPKGF